MLSTGHKPAMSVVLVVYNMAREAPRTLYSLSATYQRDISADDYEVIVIDNGSTPPFDTAALRDLKCNFRLIRIDNAAPSPVNAINTGVASAKADLIGVMIDGARIASPGLLASALQAEKLGQRTIVLSLAFHLGLQVQPKSILEGYNQEVEDRLLAESGWMEDGYRLFGISVFGVSSSGGWLNPINESNAIFMRKALWDELGGFDERFQSPGGGYVNMDTLSRAVTLPDVTVVTLLGEATFHQVHGGIATNALENVNDAFAAEYLKIRGRPFQTPDYQTLYLGKQPKSNT